MTIKLKGVKVGSSGNPYYRIEEHNGVYCLLTDTLYLNTYWYEFCHNLNSLQQNAMKKLIHDVQNINYLRLFKVTKTILENDRKVLKLLLIINGY